MAWGMQRSRKRVLALASVLSSLCLLLRSSPAFLAPVLSPGAGRARTNELGAASVPAAAVPAATVPAATGAVTADGAASAVGGAAALAALALWGMQVRQRRGVASASGRTALFARGGASAPLVVIAGPPAAGKGTQCDKIKAMYGYVHISTGDILRENVKNGTELGKKAKEFMDAGALVPSELIVDLVKDRLNQADVKAQGCLLDGFPRAPDQAKALVDAGVQIQRFLLIKVPDDTLVERGCGRRLDPQTGDIYHLKFKPPPADIVDRLVHRSDDQEDKIRARLQAYHSQIDAILPFFKSVVYEVDGNSKPDDVFQSVQKGLENL